MYIYTRYTYNSMDDLRSIRWGCCRQPSINRSPSVDSTFACKAWIRMAITRSVGYLGEAPIRFMGII